MIFAFPLLRVALPTLVPLLTKATVPVGVVALEETVAVSVTGCPNAEGLGLETKAVVGRSLPPEKEKFQKAVSNS